MFFSELPDSLTRIDASAKIIWHTGLPCGAHAYRIFCSTSRPIEYHSLARPNLLHAPLSSSARIKHFLDYSLGGVELNSYRPSSDTSNHL